MRLIERQLAHVTVVDVSGKVAMATVPGSLKERVAELIGQGHRELVIGLGGVTYMDSSGLGELVACHLTAAKHGAVVKLAAVGPRTAELLHLTKLDTIFEIYPTEAQAAASFNGRAA